MELIQSGVWHALYAAGLRVLPVTADQITIGTHPADATGAVRMHVLTRSHPLSPGELRKLADRHPGPTLVIVPTATAAARATASQLGWSLIATNPRSSAGPHGQVLLPSGRIVQVGTAQPDHAAPPAPAKPGRVPWGALTLLRRLAEGAEGTQAQLAELAAITQARVSQALKELVQAGLVWPASREHHRYAVIDPVLVVQHWLASYPGPGGISTYWYGLDDPTGQAKATVALLREPSGAGGPAVSGDVAADQVAPWRRPQRAVVYAHHGADLEEIGLTPAAAEDATLELTVPRDPGVWPAPASQHVLTWPGPPGLPLADPLQILWDVRRAPGSDRDQAADRLLAALTARSPVDPGTAAWA